MLMRNALMVSRRDGVRVRRPAWAKGVYVSVNSFGEILEENFAKTKQFFEPNFEDCEADDWEVEPQPQAPSRRAG